MSPLRRVSLWVGAIIVLSWLSLVLMSTDEAIAIGYFLGSLSAQVTLAAAWAALGPGRLVVRLPLSILWVFSLWIAVGLHFVRQSAPSDAMLVVGALMLVQWLLLQLPLAGLVWGLGLQLRHRDETGGETNAVQVRFGIRHLLLIMLIAGIFLGVGQALVPQFDMSSGREIFAFIFLGVAGVVMTFPLLVATLMRRRALPGVLLALAYIGAATVAEIPLFQHLGGEGPGPEHFIAINVVSTIVIFLIALIVRLHGYSLQKKPQSAEA